MWEAIKGDCLDVVWKMDDDSVDLVITSPPYSDARLYLEGGEDLKIAKSVGDWVDWMVDVCAELERVCVGPVFINCCGSTRNYQYNCAPEMLAAELCKVGYNMRRGPVFHRHGIPGSGGPDWWRNDWENVVAFSRPGKLPWSDPTAAGHPPKHPSGGCLSNRTRDDSREKRSYTPPKLVNPGNVITGNVGKGHMGSDISHENEAPFPEWFVEPFIKCFCPPGGTVLDPFCGSGTTLAAAVKNGRRAIGIDMRQSQIDITERRMVEVESEIELPLFGE